MTVTEQSHAFICRWCCILISKVIVGYVFRVLLLDLLLFMFRRLYSYALSGICFRLGMAHFSAFDDITAFLFKFVRIRF